MNTRLHRFLRLTIVASSVVLGACMHWEELSPQTAGGLTLDSTQVYRLKLRSGGDTVIAHPQLVGDSVVWTTQKSAGTYWVPDRHTMPASNIRGESVERASLVGSVLLVGLAFMGLFAAIHGIGGAGLPPGFTL